MLFVICLMKQRQIAAGILQYYVLLLAIHLIQDHVASYDMYGQDQDPSPKYSNNASN